MPRLLVVSNGKGEDYVASRVVTALRAVAPGVEVAAFPLVGLGEQLDAVGVEVVGPRRRMPSEGFTMHSPAVLAGDLRAGLVGLTLGQARFLRSCRPDAVLVVGDVYAQAHAALTGAPRRVIQTLVSVHHGGGEGPGLRWFMEGFRGPELPLLRRADRVYARDPTTAAWLERSGVAAKHLGNPMMDGLDVAPLPGMAEAASRGAAVVALLPGSRGQAADSVQLMLRALQLGPPVVGLVAWTGSDLPGPPPGYVPVTSSFGWAEAEWRSGDARVFWTKGSFAAVLASARAAIGTAGTANEQAVGSGLPVVAFPVPPFYGEAYMRNQRRLLGRGLMTAEARPERVVAMLSLALEDGYRSAAAEDGSERMGSPGAASRIASDFADWAALSPRRRPPTAARPAQAPPAAQ